MISRVVSAERGAGDHSGDGKARRVGETALARLREIAERCPLVRSVRGVGLLHAIEVCGDTVAGRTASWPSRSRSDCSNAASAWSFSPDVAISTSAPRHFPAERALENESRAVAE
jgi:hypothetical protein